MKNSRRAILVTAALITLLFAPAAQANTLVATSPIAGSTLKAGPSAITITTEFPLIEEGNEIVVTDPNGKRVDTGILTVLGTDVLSTPSASATPQPSASATAEPVGSNFGTNLFVISLLGLSILVLVGMGAYARKIFKEK